MGIFFNTTLHSPYNNNMTSRVLLSTFTGFWPGIFSPHMTYLEHSSKILATSLVNWTTPGSQIVRGGRVFQNLGEGNKNLPPSNFILRRRRMVALTCSKDKL